MTAKIKASSDGLEVTIGNAAEDALEINQTAKTIKGINGYLMAGNGPAFSARMTTNVTLSSGVAAKATFNSLSFDTNNNFSTANSRFQPTVPGFYQINAGLRWVQ